MPAMPPAHAPLLTRSLRRPVAQDIAVGRRRGRRPGGRLGGGGRRNHVGVPGYVRRAPLPHAERDHPREHGRGARGAVGPPPAGDEPAGGALAVGSGGGAGAITSASQDTFAGHHCHTPNEITRVSTVGTHAVRSTSTLRLTSRSGGPHLLRTSSAVITLVC